MKYIHEYIIKIQKCNIIHKLYDNGYMDVREEVKFMLLKRCVTLTELAKRMTVLIGKQYTQSLLSHKLKNQSLKYTEMQVICQILSCKLLIEVDEIILSH